MFENRSRNGNINDLTEIDIRLIIITNSLVIHNLSLVAIVFCVKYEKLIDKIQALESLINEHKKNIQAQTEECRQGPITPPH